MNVTEYSIKLDKNKAPVETPVPMYSITLNQQFISMCQYTLD